LDTRTTLRAADRITAHTDPSVDRVRHHLYIDDLNLFGPDREAVERAQTEYVRAVESIGLVVKASKRVAPSRHGVECVGLEVHGTAHTVGVSAAKLERLRRDTHRLIARRVCSGWELSHVVGRWTWACMASRPALSVFGAVYRFIECARHRTFEVWSSVARELRVMCGLSPLLFAQTDAPWFDRVVATDASTTGQGVVASRPGALDPVSVLSVRDDQSVIEHCECEMAHRAGARWVPIVASR